MSSFRSSSVESLTGLEMASLELDNCLVSETKYYFAIADEVTLANTIVTNSDQSLLFFGRALFATSCKHLCTLIVTNCSFINNPTTLFRVVGNETSRGVLELYDSQVIAISEDLVSFFVFTYSQFIIIVLQQ